MDDEIIDAGRPNRKLRQFAGKIAALRAKGLSIAGIHRTLIAQDVTSSYGCVRREVAKLSKQPPPARRPPKAAQEPPSPTPPKPDISAPSTKGTRTKADVFFDTHHSNPLLDKLRNPK